MFETFKKMKSDKKQVFADIVYFDLISHSEKKRENSNRGQKMSAKVCQKFLYCDLTLGRLIFSRQSFEFKDHFNFKIGPQSTCSITKVII
jgi:hypothetical protein